MDPRVARTHEAVMAAATDLLVEGGPEALTVDGVVARSGVAKSTVYRHWATRDALVIEVLSSCAPDIPEIPAELAFEDSLRELVRSFVAVLGDEHWARVLPALLVLKSELGEVAELDERMKEQQSDVVETVLRKGVDEGAMPPDVLDDPHMAVTLLAGPVLMAQLTALVPLDEELVEQVVHQFLAGHARPVAGTARRTPTRRS